MKLFLELRWTHHSITNPFASKVGASVSSEVASGNSHPNGNVASKAGAKARNSWPTAELKFTNLNDLSESSDVSKNQGVVFVEYYQELTELSWNPTALPTVYGFTPINTSCPNEPSDCNERVLLMRLAQSFEQSFLRFLNIFGFLVFAHHPHRDVAQQGDRIATWKSRSTLINQSCHQWLVLGSS